MNNSVTKILNDLHDTSRGSVGSPQDIPVHGWPLTPSINFSSAYAFTSIRDLGIYHEDKFQSVRYGRDSSILVRQLEGYFSALFNDAPALLFDSGMAAMSAAINSLIHSGVTVCTIGSQYRKTHAILKQLEKNFGLRFQQYESDQALIAADSVDDDLVIIIESPAHPFLRLTDISAIREAYPSARIILDTSFQGLMNDKGVNSKADIIVSSCTKYIGGHNDLLGGVVACNNSELYPELWNQRSTHGGILDNMSAYLLFRSLRTYDIRMEKGLSNTRKVLEFLNESERVHKLYYPGAHENKDQEALFRNNHFHGGCVVTFVLNDQVKVEETITELHSTKMAPSFGSVDSLIEIPLYMSHWHDKNHATKELGLTRSTIRLSVGNEPIEAILADLRRLTSIN